MSFLAKLQQLKQTAKVTTDIQRPGGTSGKNTVRNNSVSLLPENYVRKVDPAIQRLKEARRLKQAASANAPGKAPVKNKRTSSPKEEVPIYRRKPGSNTAAANPVVVPKRKPIKKLSFDELMRQAEDKSKSHNGDGKKASLPKHQQQHSTKHSANGPKSPRHQVPSSAKRSKETFTVAPSFSGFAKPNEKLVKKLKLKSRQRSLGNDRDRREAEDHYLDEDLSDFIDDDTEGFEKEESYDREEIWSIFNKGRKRRFDDYDDEDNMEANEMEILEEEERASKLARLEDKREEQWLKKHEAEKKKMKK